LISDNEAEIVAILDEFGIPQLEIVGSTDKGHD